MAIKVSGTTVIDDNRNFKNLGNITGTGNIYANTFIGDGSQLSNLPAGGSTVEMVASGTLSDGSKVIVNSDGTVSVPARTDFSKTTSANQGFSAGNQVHEQSSSNQQLRAVYDPDQKRVVVFYVDATNNQYPTVVAGEVSDLTITFGTPVVIHSASATFIDICYDKSSGYHACVYSLYSNQWGYLKSVKVTGSTVTQHYDNTFNTSTPTWKSVCYDESAERVVILWTQSVSGSSRIRNATISKTNGSISFGSESYLDSSNQISYAIDSHYDSVNGKCVFSYSIGPALIGYLVAVSTSGSNSTAGTPVSFSGGSASYFNRMTYDTARNAYVVLYKQGNSWGYYRVLTLSGTTFTDRNSGMFQINMGSSTTLDSTLVYDPDQNVTFFVYTSGGYLISKEATMSSSYVLDIDDSYKMFSANTYSKQPDAIYDPNQRRIVVPYINGNNNQGEVKIQRFSYSTTTLTEGNYIGISDGAYANGANASIQTIGTVDDAQSGLTAGSFYYLQPDGTLSTSAGMLGDVAGPSVIAGQALSSTTLAIKNN